MNNTLKLIFVALLVIAMGGYFFPSQVSKYFGAEGDTNFTNLVLSGYATVAGALTQTGAATFNGTSTATANAYVNKLIYGTGKTTRTTGTTTTLSAANVCSGNIIAWVPTVANATFTLPTAANLVADCMTATGNVRELLILNDAATSTFNVASSTGTTALMASSTDSSFVISSSSPLKAMFIITLASGTDSTAQVLLNRYFTVSY